MIIKNIDNELCWVSRFVKQKKCRKILYINEFKLCVRR